MLVPAAVIFDMDGTLVDTERLSQAAWRQTARDLGVDLSPQMLAAFVGCSLPDARVMLEDALGDTALIDRMFARKQEVFLQLEDKELEMRPGALEAVRALDRAGITVALATTTAREHALPLMERFGFAPYFASMTFGDEIRRAKPDPDIYLEAARRLGVEPACCVAVEDSVNGVLAAVAAGMQTYMVPEWVEATPQIAAVCAGVLPGLEDVPAAILSTAATSARTAATPAHIKTGPHAPERTQARNTPQGDPAFYRAENEDDDGYDPYSDRRPEPEPLFERDPWG